MADDPTLDGHEQALRLLGALVLGPWFIVSAQREVRNPAIRALFMASGAAYAALSMAAFLRAREVAATIAPYRYEPPVTRTI